MAPQLDAEAATEYPPGEFPVEVVAEPFEVRSGDLLVIDQGAGSVVRIRDGTPQTIVSVSSWSHSYLFDTATNGTHLYVSTTGLNVPGTPYYFGIKGVGCILEIECATGRLVRRFAYPTLVDPAGLALLSDGTALIVADFNGFSGGGKVLSIDLLSGTLTRIAGGDPLVTPVGLNLTSDGRALAASAGMPEARPMGGEVVAVDLATGEQELVYTEEPGRGELIGVGFVDGTIVATRSDWPDQRSSAVIAVTGPRDARELYQPDLGWMSSGIAVDGDGVWVAESVTRTLVKIDLEGVVREEIELEPGREPQKLHYSTATLESVRLVS